MNINNLKPFGRFCVTLGMIPSSYKESLTYEEQLLWFCNYLETEVIPKYNENVEAINELITLYDQLQEYVQNYFDTLDIQTEIDNKLDEMAESGELTDIIAQYLQLAGVLAYNTISDLSSAENIVNGSICYVLGQTTYNDGKGGFYKIRTVTSGDTIDGFNIVALDVSDTLIAERMPNYYINTLETNLSTLDSEFEESASYSSTEKRIGTWKNGKPLYRKIISDTVPSYTDTLAVKDISIDSHINYGFIESAEVFIYNSQYRPTPTIAPDMSGFVDCMFNEALHAIRVRNSYGDANGVPIDIIFCYTKDTD